MDGGARRTGVDSHQRSVNPKESSKSPSPKSDRGKEGERGAGPTRQPAQPAPPPSQQAAALLAKSGIEGMS